MTIDITDKGKNNRIEIHKSVERSGNLRIEILGNNNRLRIGPKTRLAAGLIEIRNHESEMTIGEGCVISGQLRLRADDTRLIIGDQTTMMGAQITLHEAGTIRLGRDCMLSGNITMDVSDMHSILDAKTGTRINPPEDIEIGDHVWIAQGVQILKGARIGSNCIIGAKSLVSGDTPEGSLAAGVPARVMKSGVTWDRRRLPVEK
ncbi:acyltransferase [Roseovarius sp. MMSF_3281]|uniref:acyltransferase n=1 Tax=Roseovarius sp. MMSF_3281 TaxID=3046694 RepID=UPI00273CFBF8|nr:acyltransferase [Roseovarius sp. MMSF_3281]